jgi:integrase
MTDTRERRGRRGDGTVFFEHEKDTNCRDAHYHRSCTGRWRGVLSDGADIDGRRRRVKVSGQTKADVLAELKRRQDELGAGVRTSAAYTVRQCCADWLRDGLDGRSAKTREIYTEALAPLLALIGDRPLRSLTATQVRAALVKIASTLSSSSVARAHNSLSRAIDRAAAHDLVSRNVSMLAERPSGMKPGRPSRAMTRDVLAQLLSTAAAECSPVSAYTVLCALTGVRTEEARALLWSDIDLSSGVVSVVRSTRSHGGTKTPGSRRALELAPQALEALEKWKQRQEDQRTRAGAAWQGDGEVFTTAIGSLITARDLRHRFTALCVRAGIGEKWTLRELRTTFVGILSESGVGIEQIAHVVGHSTSRTTEAVYRKELRPVIRTGAAVMGSLMSGR